MRSLSANTEAALGARSLVVRDFMTITARDRDTGAPVTEGYWSDVGSINAPVIDPETGLTSYRDFFGSGTLIALDAIPLVSNLSVQAVKAKFSQIDDRIEELVRLYDVRQGRVEIFRGLFDTASRNIVDPATPRFVGFVDDLEIETPSEGDVGEVVLTFVSHTQELTKSNPDMRSHESQRARSAGDNFFRHAGVVGDWEFFWGKKSGTISTETSSRTTGSGVSEPTKYPG